jgi:hypothetical protein
VTFLQKVKIIRAKTIPHELHPPNGVAETRLFGKRLFLCCPLGRTHLRDAIVIDDPDAGADLCIEAAGRP